MTSVLVVSSLLTSDDSYVPVAFEKPGSPPDHVESYASQSHAPRRYTQCGWRCSANHFMSREMPIDDRDNEQRFRRWGWRSILIPSCSFAPCFNDRPKALLQMHPIPLRLCSRWQLKENNMNTAMHNWSIHAALVSTTCKSCTEYVQEDAIPHRGSPVSAVGHAWTESTYKRRRTAQKTKMAQD